MQARGLIIAAVFTLASVATAADERPAHFKGEASETLTQAVSNLSDYNNRLSKVIGKDELTPADLHQVHELTYTLENALEKIQEELAEIAETLEEVHVASESSDPETVKTRGRVYLEASRQLVK